MPCVHLRQLYKLCEENQLKMTGSDLIQLVCKQCDEKEVCPSVLTDEYDASEAAKAVQALANADLAAAGDDSSPESSSGEGGGDGE